MARQSAASTHQQRDAAHVRELHRHEDHGEANAPLCNWMPKEGDARTCRSCAVARRFCIVNVGGCPTVLRNPLDRVVDGVDGLGVAREGGGDW